MEVREIIRSKLEFVTPDNTLIEAAGIMKKSNVGALPVLENGSGVGFITDRDVTVRAIADGLDPKTTKVRQIMSKKLHTCSEHATLENAAELMGKNLVRRLLVVDDSKRPRGIVSFADIAAFSNRGDLIRDTVKHFKEHHA